MPTEKEERNTDDFENEHAVLKKIRLNSRNKREVGDDFKLPDSGVKVRLQILSHFETTESSKMSGTSLHRTEAVTLSMAYELAKLAITHLDNIPIEKLFGDSKILNNSLSEIQTAREIARNKLEVYLRELTDTDILAITSHYGRMIDKRVKVVEEIKSKN